MIYSTEYKSAVGNDEKIIAICSAAVTKRDIVTGNIMITDKRIIFDLTNELNRFKKNIMFKKVLSGSATVPNEVVLKNICMITPFSDNSDVTGITVTTRSGYVYKYALYPKPNESPKEIIDKRDYILCRIFEIIE